MSKETIKPIFMVFQQSADFLDELAVFKSSNSLSPFLSESITDFSSSESQKSAELRIEIARSFFCEN